MSFAEFLASTRGPVPPGGLDGPLLALWHDARGDWHRAHAVAQETGGPGGAWVHAYLHRKEGDPGNAAYWYRRAGRPVPTAALEDEWAALVRGLLETRPAGDDTPEG
ncbi:MAG: hypothetical protein JNG83_14840 [Opitutaceae bacterium]|nr:hypothetical protein [Opitutaceae bacterium]